MDWSIVVMGCVLVLLAVSRFWWERVKRVRTQKRASAGQAMRHSLAWLPLLMGLGMVIAKVPHLLGASFAIVEISDSVSVVLAVTVALIFVLQVRRRTASEPCGIDED
ncbi:hypothetical protein [Streptomyces sp. NPDC020917]|uniref:hypothetical protein n=1 Tax=Streptomyces sp. NPDC020917 TaxID=3365102 RepID=UPI00379E412D